MRKLTPGLFYGDSGDFDTDVKKCVMTSLMILFLTANTRTTPLFISFFFFYGVTVIYPRKSDAQDKPSLKRK